DTVVIKNLRTGEVLSNVALAYDAGALGPIAPAGSQARQYAFTLPDESRGVGQIQYTVTTDSGAVIFEYNPSGTAESNNTPSIPLDSTLAPYPDLRVTNLSATPASGLQSGSTMTVIWSDTNAGTRATSGSWTDAIVIKNLDTGETLASTTIAYDATAA